MIIDIVAQVAGQAGRSVCRRNAGQDAKGQRTHGHDDQNDAKVQDLAHISRVNTLVDEGGHDDGDEDLEKDLSADEDRRKDGILFVFTDGSRDMIDHRIHSFCWG